MSKQKAADIMNRDVKTIHANATLQEVAEFLTAHHISGAPVVDGNGKMVGIISESDLIDDRKRNAAIPRSAIFGFWVVPEETLIKAYEEAQVLRARDLMTRDVLSASEDTPVEELAQLMVKRRINRIPIIKEGVIVGIVTREDLVRGLLDKKDNSISSV